jgi:hypothetical protein
VTGSINIYFGGWDGRIPNCLPITNGWNYMVRLARWLICAGLLSRTTREAHRSRSWLEFWARKE